MSHPNKQIFYSPEVRVVEASAGSGKTYALAKRYVQLLLDPSLHLEQIPIRNILALTFTNKAAFEMKGRILEFLKIIALGRLSDSQEEEILKPFGMKPEEASIKAYAVMDGLIRHYNFFQVQTIDKFINTLLLGCAFKIGLTANFKIKTNYQEYLQYSLDQLIDNAPRDKKILKMFERFLDSYLYLEERRGWFPKEDILAIVCALFSRSNSYGHSFREGPFSSEDLIKKKKLILEKMLLLKSSLPEETHKGFLKSFNSFMEKSKNSFDIDSISDYFARESVPLRAGAVTPNNVRTLWTGIRNDLIQLCEKEAYSLFNSYIQIFNHVMEGFQELSAKEDCLFLGELNKKASALFDEDYITVEELYYRLAARFRHYLVDEFQDTSRLQWQNLEKMAEEALSTGGTLFYVGDRKQAIYGFRGGEIALFDDIKNNFAAFNVCEEFLVKNWRSQKAVVEFNNSVFSTNNLMRFIAEKEGYDQGKKKTRAVIFDDQDQKDMTHIFQGALQSWQNQNDKGYVRVEYVDVDKKEEREMVIWEKLIGLIKDLSKRFSYRDIAILTRSNSQVEQLTYWLLEEGILVESERTSNIKENRLIQELIYFLRFLDSPTDNMAFTMFILGELFSKATEIETEQLQDFAFGLRSCLSQEKDVYVYTEFQKQYPEVWERFIGKFLDDAGLYPLYELMVSIYSRFNCLKLFAEYQGFFMHILELIKKKEEEYTDIASFLEYFDKIEGEDLYVNVADTDAVKILTIHKSKGLEFPVVIIPYLGMDVQVGGRESDKSPSYVLRQENSFLELTRLKDKYLKFSNKLYQVYCQEYKKSFLSELNNIYVALTRPQNELYAYIPKKIKNSFNIVKFLIPEDVIESGRQASYKNGNQKKPDVIRMDCSVHHDWIDYLKDEFYEPGWPKLRKRILAGNITHYILSRIGSLNEGNQKDMIQNAVSQAQVYFPQVKDFQKYQSLLEKGLAKKVIKPFFYCQNDDVFTEKEIINSYGHTKRLDRLIIKKGQVWIVDFKSQPDEKGKYQQQVKEYKDLVSELYPELEVKGYLMYLNQWTVKEV